MSDASAILARVARRLEALGSPLTGHQVPSDGTGVARNIPLKDKGLTISGHSGHRETEHRGGCDQRPVDPKTDSGAARVESSIQVDRVARMASLAENLGFRTGHLTGDGGQSGQSRMTPRLRGHASPSGEIAAVLTASEGAWPAAAWRQLYRAKLDFWGQQRLEEEAARLAWVQLQAAWHRRHGERVSAAICAGCYRPIRGGHALALGDGARVHFANCLTVYAQRWRATATLALVAMGLSPPLRQSTADLRRHPRGANELAREEFP
jgi:hypothetical protein